MHRTTIPLAITAKNEEQAVEACLRSLLAACQYAADRLPLQWDVVLVLDDCTDGTAERVRRFTDVRTLDSSGGIVEAQRTMAGQGEFVVFSDADILVEPQTLLGVARAMLQRPELQVAYPRKSPLAPRRRTLLARALYQYNRSDGFQTRRRYFNGKLFAIRDWRVPTRKELAGRLAEMPPDRFYNFQAGMRIDDVWLSRDILRRYGPQAILETDEGAVHFRPPETLRGMYRTYRRMRMEIERLDLLFPETAETHRQFGRRTYDRAAVRAARRRERLLWRCFRAALGVCKMYYAAERLYYRRLSRTACAPWKPVTESKRLASSDCAPPA